MQEHEDPGIQAEVNKDNTVLTNGFSSFIFSRVRCRLIRAS
jgi:hypothetical protein